MSYEDFKAEYEKRVKALLNTPLGGKMQIEAAEHLADLTDEYPEFESKFDEQFA